MTTRTNGTESDHSCLQNIMFKWLVLRHPGGLLLCFLYLDMHAFYFTHNNVFSALTVLHFRHRENKVNSEQTEQKRLEGQTTGLLLYKIEPFRLMQPYKIANVSLKSFEYFFKIISDKAIWYLVLISRTIGQI